jgi:hypothetical protein
MAIGIAEIVTDEVEKELALHAICRRFLPNNMHNFKAAIEKSLNRTTVVRITLDSAPIGKCKIAEKQ